MNGWGLTTSHINPGPNFNFLSYCIFTDSSHQLIRLTLAHVHHGLYRTNHDQALLVPHAQRMIPVSGSKK